MVVMVFAGRRSSPAAQDLSPSMTAVRHGHSPGCYRSFRIRMAAAEQAHSRSENLVAGSHRAQKPNIRYCHCDDLGAFRFQEVQGTIAGGDDDRVSIFEPRPKDAETDPFEALGVGESLQERERDRGIKRGNNREAQRGKRERHREA